MATVEGVKYVTVQQLIEDNVVSGHVTEDGQLVLVARSGAEIFAGPVGLGYGDLSGRIELVESDMETLHTVTLPALDAALTAANLDLTNLNDVVLPGLALALTEANTAITDLEGKFPIEVDDLGFEIGGGNQVIDSSFESGTLTNGWSTNLAVSTEWAGSTLPYGTKSFGLWSGAADSFVYPTAVLPTIVGKKHTVTAWVYKSAGAVSTNPPRLLGFLDSASTWFGNCTLMDGTAIDFASLPTGAWTRIKLTFTAATTTGRLRLYASVNTNKIWFDNVQFELGDMPTAYSPRPDEILPNTIAEPMIQAGAIITAKMTANTINGDRITAATLNASKIVAGSITTDRMTANTISGDRISANTLDAAKIVAGSVTTDRMTANTISGDRIAANTLDAAKVVAGSITTDRMTANTINGDRITVGTLNADRIIAGSITTAKLSATAIDGMTITGAVFQTAASGRRIVIDGPGDAIKTYTGVSGETSGYIDPFVQGFTSVPGLMLGPGRNVANPARPMIRMLAQAGAITDIGGSLELLADTIQLTGDTAIVNGDFFAFGTGQFEHHVLLGTGGHGDWWHEPVGRVQTTNVTLAGGAPSTVDGGTVTVGYRILVVGQTAPAENGIYEVQTVGTGANGTWVRAADADGSAKLDGAVVLVEAGNWHKGSRWWTGWSRFYTLGTTAMKWAPQHSAEFSALSGTVAPGAESAEILVSHNYGIVPDIVVGHLEDGFFAHQFGWRVSTRSTTQVGIKFRNNGGVSGSARLRYLLQWSM